MIWMGSCTGLAERGQKERSGSPGGSKWLSAKTADWQEVWLRVGDVGACEWLRGFGILTNETLSLAGGLPYRVRLAGSPGGRQPKP
jgi:hypothetical protein